MKKKWKRKRRWIRRSGSRSSKTLWRRQKRTSRKGGPASRAFTTYLKTWSGNTLVENYAKRWHFAKNLSGKPQTDKFKLLKQAVEEKEELREAIAEGLVPAPMGLGDLAENERQARNYEARKKNKRRKGRGKGTILKRGKGL